MRCTPLLMKHYEKTETPPELFALGFAAYLYFMRAVTKKGNQYFGEINGQSYLIQDEQAEIFYKRWAGLNTATLVQETLKDYSFWEDDLYSLPGFQQSVTDKLNLIANNGMKEAIESIPVKKIIAA